MHKRALLAVFLLSIMLIFAQDSYAYEQSKGELSGFLYDYGIALALTVSFVLVGLGFMAARVFSSRELEMWSRIELREAFVSTLYVGLAVLLIPVFNSLVDGFLVAPPGVQKMYTYTDIFSSVIDTALKKAVELSLFMGQAGVMNAIGWIPTAFNSFVVVSWSSSLYYTPQSAYSLVFVFAGIFSPILIMGIFSVASQFLLLIFLEKVLYIFLGLAIFLRAFAFTRRMGSTLFGIFLGGFLFLKLALVFEAGIYSSLAASGQMADAGKESILDTGVGNLVSPIGKLFNMLFFPKYLYDFCMWFDNPCEKASSFWKYMCYVIAWYYLCIPIGAFVWIYDVMATMLNLVLQVILTAKAILSAVVGGPGAIGLMIADEISTQIAVTSDIMVFAYFMPFFNVIFTLTGIIAFVQALGGDESVVNMLTFI